MKSADDLIWPGERAQSWFQGHTLEARHLPPPIALAARKRAEGLSVSVALPALNEGTTVGSIVDVVRRELMERLQLVDELVVLDGGSSDDTAGVAEAAGASVVRIPDVLPQVPLVPGKGESLWRSLSVLTG